MCVQAASVTRKTSPLTPFCLTTLGDHIPPFPNEKAAEFDDQFGALSRFFRDSAMPCRCERIGTSRAPARRESRNANAAARVQAFKADGALPPA